MAENVANSLMAWMPKLPPIALAVGIVIGLLGLWPWKAQAKTVSKTLIQVSIVLLGFWISIDQVMKAGLAGLALSTAAIVLALGASWALTKWLRTDREAGTLLTAGTTICGGSAIAATGSAINASSGAIAASTAIVFLLNAAGVYVYPLIGRQLGLSDAQFGAWCAVGVHDVAGVVAAAKSYSDAALADATVIKLTRVLWIVPVALVLRWQYVRASRQSGVDVGQAKSPFPWFIVWFVGACVLRSVLDRFAPGLGAAAVANAGKNLATILLAVALFLVGTGISVATVRALGWRPLAHGLILWIAVSVTALLAVRAMM